MHVGVLYNLTIFFKCSTNIYIWGTRQEFDLEQVKNLYDTRGREEDAARFKEVFFFFGFCVCLCVRERERDGSLVWFGGYLLNAQVLLVFHLVI